MTIENEALYNSTRWDFACFDSCFSGKIKMSDIDGIVEKNNRFFWFESKSPGVTMPLGQRIAFERLVMSGGIGVHVVFVVWGERNAPERYQVWRRSENGLKKDPEIDCDLEALKSRISSWYRWAEMQRKPSNWK